jgi:hypothetical protein
LVTNEDKKGTIISLDKNCSSLKKIFENINSVINKLSLDKISKEILPFNVKE